MEKLGIITFVLIIANFLVSYKGFSNRLFYYRNLFEVERILHQKQYSRLITSGFLHTGWIHLGFNMLTLYAFGVHLELFTGKVYFLIIYFSSLLGGELLSLYIHRNQSDYSSVGASGAVCGIIFASVAVFPGLELGLLGMPLFIPSWGYGILFVLISIYGIRSQASNVGHDAHLGGALVGMLVAVSLYPSSLKENYIPILLVSIPSLTFIIILMRYPTLLLMRSSERKNAVPVYQTIDEKYYTEKKNKQEELDRLLEKIHQNGIDSLTKKERETLEDLSK